MSVLFCTDIFFIARQNGRNEAIYSDFFIIKDCIVRGNDNMEKLKSFELREEKSTFDSSICIAIATMNCISLN